MSENRRPAGRKTPPRRADRFAQRQEIEEVEGQLEGRNAVSEALKSGRTIDKIFVADGDIDKGLQRLAAQAKEAGAVVVPVDRRKLDAMSFTRAIWVRFSEARSAPGHMASSFPSAAA